MPRLSGRVALLLLAALALAPVGAQAKEPVSKVVEEDHPPVFRPGAQLPDDPDMLFYIQRSLNANVVVYGAHFDAPGKLDAKAPVDVYWRRFKSAGDRVPLSYMERMFAYGVSAKPAANGTFTLNLVSLPERPLTLALDAAGHPHALLKMGGRMASLAYVYIESDDKGLLPKVLSVDLVGYEEGSGKILHEHLIPQ